MTTISRAATESSTGARLERIVADTKAILPENGVPQEKAPGTTLVLSEEGKALFEQSLVSTQEDAATEQSQARARIEIIGDEDTETLHAKFRSMNAEDKEAFVQKRLSGFDNGMKIVQQVEERRSAQSGKPSKVERQEYVTRDFFEAATRSTVEFLASSEPVKVNRANDVTKDFIRPDKIVGSTEYDKKMAISNATSAAARANEAKAFRYEENHAITLPNISDLPLDVAKTSLGIAESIVKNREDVGLSVRGRYGDKAISDMKTYLASIKDHISKLEVGLAASNRFGV
ncbi:hypothetical protein [Rhodoferax saidenbachensis]|uniref:Uncharacterized protein n=1 Tax=Rhodoferax saidenbachensis TaxID=1484693 RepID=A0A1P8KE81_9BURK|nr:hypothetical protein [Rhodoferax saidenbachensis]APW44248.1 hypothetical protein RS694_18075 [Rhodoferax saidenbachensis]